jgi:hypothetical protein
MRSLLVQAAWTHRKSKDHCLWLEQYFAEQAASEMVYLCFLPVVTAGIQFNAADAGCSE